MKWIGQHIYDFISRFRSDVYLEAIESGTIASGGNLGLDSNNKIVKADTEAGELAFSGSTANGVLTYGGASQIDVESTLTYSSGTLTNIGAVSLLQLDGVTNVSVLAIANLDADQKVIDISAGNTTADIIDIGSTTLTTGAIINCDITQTGLNTALLDYNIINTDTATSISYFESVDFNKTGVTGDGEAFAFKGILIDYDDSATNHANSSVTAVGIDVDLTNSSDQGTIAQTGIDINLTGADAANSNGLIIRTPNGASDIKVKSQINANDLFTLDTKDDGETTLTTIENGGGSTAHFNVVADGHINLQTVSEFNLTLGDAEFFNFKNSANGNPFIRFFGEDDNYSLLEIFERGGNTTNDQFAIEVTEHAETDVRTTDAGGSAAHITLRPDGDLKLRPNTGDTLLISSTSAKPSLQLQNTNTDAVAPEIVFQKTANGADGDDLGSIFFKGDDVAGNVETYAQILGEIQESADGDEEGVLTLAVASHDGELQSGLDIKSGSAEDLVDVTIGNGAASTTSIAGYLETNGKITIKNSDYLYLNNADNSYQTRLNAGNTAASNKTIVLPNESGTVQLQGSSAGQTFNVPLKVDDLYILYVTTVNTWFHTGYVGQSLGTAIGSELDSTAMRAVSYVAPSACKVNKVTIAFYMTGSADLEFQVTKIPLVDGSNSNVTLAAMTHNDINFSASANYNYVKTMTMTGAGSDNELSAGQAFTLAVRQTGGSYTRVLYGNCFAEIELT
jgi:hypothetical protein